MATIRQSIDIQVAAPALYSQLTRYEEFPRFLQDVDAVRRLDEDRLHWTMRAAHRKVEWEAYITAELPDRRIAWQNRRVPGTTGSFDLQAVGDRATRLTLTLTFEPEQVPDAPAAFSESDMAQRLEQDLARLKKFVESDRYENAGAHRDADSAARSTQPDNILSSRADESADDAAEGEHASVAEEVSFDQQSDAARHAGRMPDELDVGAADTKNPQDAMAESLRPDMAPDEAALNDKNKQALERALPPLP
jgi:uncharacterized membrane protein